MGLLSSCDPVDQKLVIDNQTNEEIIYKIKTTKNFGDTVLFNKWNLTFPDTSYTADLGRIDPKSKRNIASMFGTGFNTWEKGIQEDCENGMVTVFIFNKSTLKRKPFSQILADKDYRSFTLSTEDLEKIEWTIEVQ